MKKFLIKWVLMVVSVIVAAFVARMVPGGGFNVDTTAAGIVKLFFGTAILGFVNATVGRLLKFLTFPISCLTLGIFSLVINAALFWAVGSLGLGFQVDGFLGAFIGSLLVSAVNAVLGIVVPEEKKEE